MPEISTALIIKIIVIAVAIGGGIAVKRHRGKLWISMLMLQDVWHDHNLFHSM